MKTQIVVYALQTLILAAVHLAEAQQQQSGKVLRIGYLSGSGSSRSSVSPAPRHSGRVCGKRREET